MKKFFAVLLVIILSLSALAGCSGGSALTGVYKLASFTLEGETYSAADLDELLGTDSNGSYIEFLDGGKCKMSLFGEIDEATFKLSGNTVTITDSDGVAVPGTVDGNRITLDTEDGAAVFEKQ